MDKLDKKIAIIGAGNMGQAIAQGLLSKKLVTQDQFILTTSKTGNNKEAVGKADVVILAIKPQIARAILEEIRGAIKDQIIISIMAGIKIDTIQNSLGKEIAVIRVMPNLAAKVGKSMSVWVKSKEVTKTHEKYVKDILRAIGVELELQKEEQINAATAISGSGPAYFFYLTELMEKEAQKLGFSQEEARVLTSQTLLGSAELLRVSNQSAEELRHSVISKGGTTEAAIETFQKAEIQATIRKGIFAVFERAKGIDAN